MDQNKIIIEGMVVRDPRSQMTGAEVINLSFTVLTETLIDQEHTSKAYHRVVCWREVAQQVQQYGLREGSRVLVEGRMVYGSYTNQQGQKVPTATVNADVVEVR